VPMMVSKTTSETLKRKINPSAGQAAPQAVDVLLYTPGHLNLSEVDEDANPKLWCALSDGKVVVFDATSWSMRQNCIQVGTSKLVRKGEKQPKIINVTGLSIVNLLVKYINRNTNSILLLAFGLI
ncbi:DEND3 protein, partial [Polyodon spathula]|nr:DEND3 protein [Polyodon spathula]